MNYIKITDAIFAESFDGIIFEVFEIQGNKIIKIAELTEEELKEFDEI